MRQIPEAHQTPHHPEDLGGQQRVHLPSVRVGPQHLQYLATADDDLLQLGARELAVHAVRDASGALEGQVVEVHLVGGASKASPSRLCKITNQRSLGKGLEESL